MTNNKANQFKRPADRITLGLDLGSVVLPMVMKWLESGTYAGKIVTHERVSGQVLRVTLPWNVARYIVEHVEQFAESGIIDTLYNPVVDPAVMAEIEAEKAAAEELARKKKEEAEALVLHKRAAAEVAKVQREMELEADKARRNESALRRLLVEYVDEDSGTFDYMGETSTVYLLRDYLTKAFPHTVSIMRVSDSILRAELAPPLRAAITNDPISFAEKGWVESLP